MIVAPSGSALFRSLRFRSISTGLIGGFFSGLTGVGGGTLMVPLLSGYLRLPQHTAHGTSLLIVVPVAAAAALSYIIWCDEIEWDLVGALLGGSIVGAYIGAVLIMRVRARELQLIFAALLLAAGIRMLIT